MITPAPVIMENESGRTFRVELGRMEKDAMSQEPSQELKQDTQDNTKDSKANVVTKEGSALSVQEQDPNANMHWQRYYCDQFKGEGNDMFMYFKSNEGVCNIDGIKFNINDDL